MPACCRWPNQIVVSGFASRWLSQRLLGPYQEAVDGILVQVKKTDLSIVGEQPVQVRELPRYEVCVAIPEWDKNHHLLDPVGGAARQLPAYRRISTAYTSSESTHDPIGTPVCQCASVVARSPLSKARVATALDPLTSNIADAFAQGQTVPVAGLAKFAARARAAHQGNPRIGDLAAVSAPRVPSFKVAKTFRDALNP